MKNYFSSNTQKRIDDFLLECHHLLRGLKFFKDNGIVHNDLKPQNILFNLDTGQMRFIDFGLMRTKAQITQLSTNSRNSLASFHWSYPLDSGVMNKKSLNQYKKLKTDHQIQMAEQFVLAILYNKKLPTPLLQLFRLNHPESFEIFFRYITPKEAIPLIEARTQYIMSFFEGLGQKLKTHTYDKILDDIIDSIDIHGLGFSLQYVIDGISQHLSTDVFSRLTAFLKNMYEPNPLKRNTDINKLLNEFEILLQSIGVLQRKKIHFQNNRPVHSKHVLLAKEPQHPMSKELDQIASKNVVELTQMSSQSLKSVKKTKRKYTKRTNKNTTRTK
jgi:serine/threonine protein kinase